MEKFFILLLLSPYFYFFYWIEKVDKDSKYFALVYYFYWIYLSLFAVSSLAFTVFSFLIFNIVLKNPADLTIWGIWILLVFLSLVNDWKAYVCLKRMFKLRQVNNRGSSQNSQVLQGGGDAKGKAVYEQLLQSLYPYNLPSLVPHVFSSLGLANGRSFNLLFRYEKTLCGFWCFIHPILRIN